MTDILHLPPQARHWIAGTAAVLVLGIAGTVLVVILDIADRIVHMEDGRLVRDTALVSSHL